MMSFGTFGQNYCPASTEPCAFTSLGWVSLALVLVAPAVAVGTCVFVWQYVRPYEFY